MEVCFEKISQSKVSNKVLTKHFLRNLFYNYGFNKDTIWIYLMKKKLFFYFFDKQKLNKEEKIIINEE